MREDEKKNYLDKDCKKRTKDIGEIKVIKEFSLSSLIRTRLRNDGQIHC